MEKKDRIVGANNTMNTVAMALTVLQKYTGVNLTEVSYAGMFLASGGAGFAFVTPSHACETRDKPQPQIEPFR